MSDLFFRNSSISHLQEDDERQVAPQSQQVLLMSLLPLVMAAALAASLVIVGVLIKRHKRGLKIHPKNPYEMREDDPEVSDLFR